jgi:osmotically-inducible protein OsmY
MQTADKQSNAKADRDITAKIRKDLMADKSLSTYGHNVKIVTVNGTVTLKGPVKSEDEKTKIAQIAGNTVTADKIANEITVK